MPRNDPPQRQPIDPFLVEAIEQSDLDALLTRLVGFAHRMLRRYLWHGTPGEPPPGQLAEDFVQTAFERLFSGDRTYRSNVDLYVLVAGIVRSVISHLAEKDENGFIHTDIDGYTETLADWKAITKEMDLLAATVVADLLDAFPDDEKIRAYIALRLNETCETAEEYARALGVSRTEIFNMNRRLARFRKNSGDGTRPRHESDERAN
jgi:DNA-directed RNA polymerase specialized sigma24 family protein